MTKPPSTTFIFVDRRKTGRGKSLNNRQKLLDRIKDSIRSAKPEDIDAGGVKKANGGAAKTFTNPVAIARDALHEPTFHYDPHSGEREVILVGNDHWERGDEFPVGGGKGRGDSEAGHGEDGEDDFIVNISRSEFYDVYFEDCEFPDLQETSEKVLPEAIWKPAGFQKEGNASQLHVIRSYRNSIGRRRALTVESRTELESLEAELEGLYDELSACGFDRSRSGEIAIRTRIDVINARIDELKTKIRAVPSFEKVDLRYRKSEKVQVKSADAVLCMAMDISGSMDEDKKRIARKFFTLQYAFIERKHPNTDLIFIIHTDTAAEVNEEEFFTTRKSGGTTVSPALALANKILSERYDSDNTNIYLSYAGDGDNWEDDNRLVLEELENKGLLARLRHAVYIQVGASIAATFGGWGSGSNLWNTMLSASKTNPKMHAIKIADESEVFSSFKKVYGKKKVA